MTDRINVTKIVFIIKNIIKVLFVKNDNEHTESIILFQKININKISFDAFFLKNECYKILFNYLNIIQILFGQKNNKK